METWVCQPPDKIVNQLLSDRVVIGMTVSATLLNIALQRNQEWLEKWFDRRIK